MLELTKKHCATCKTGISPLAFEQIQIMLKKVPKWQPDKNVTKIYRIFQFKNFYQTIAFVNAVAWIANQENHHPRLEIEYNKCIVEYWTHTIGTVSENDFICAAKIDLLCSNTN